MLLLTIRPDVNVPIDKKTGVPVDYVEARVNALIEKLEKDKIKIIIPTPALSEVLIDAGKDMYSLMENIQKNSAFRIISFDNLAAVELAAMTYNAKKKGDKRSGVKTTWAEIKFDRQIVAIAKVHNATTIYSDDDNLQSFAEQANINVIKLADLPIPAKKRQTSFLFNKRESFDFQDENLKNQKDNDQQEKKTE
jgi:predicted nucleic acid-binding protein